MDQMRTGAADGAPTVESEPAKRRVATSVVLVTAGLALAVGGVVGFVAGWQVEQRRTDSDITFIRPVGTISDVSDGRLSVRLRTSGGTHAFVLTDATVINRASEEDRAELAEGDTVLLRTTRGPDGALEAREIIVLPDTSTWSTR